MFIIEVYLLYFALRDPISLPFLYSLSPMQVDTPPGLFLQGSLGLGLQSHLHMFICDRVEEITGTFYKFPYEVCKLF